MNNRNMALSLMDNIGTVRVIYAGTATINFDRLDTSMKQYTFVYDKDRFSLEAGDKAVVLTAGKYAVVTVVEAHEESEIDLNASYDYVLITDKVEEDKTTEERVVLAVKVINESQRNEVKQKLISQFAGNMSANQRLRLQEAGIIVAQVE